MDYKEFFKKFNSIDKEIGSIYRELSRKSGIAESTFWIIYEIKFNGGDIKQKDIVTSSFLPPQTINTALKKMETEGLITLISQSDKRCKTINLTEKGESIAKEKIIPIIRAEDFAVRLFDDDKQRLFLDLYYELKENIKVSLKGIK